MVTEVGTPPISSVRKVFDAVQWWQQESARGCRSDAWLGGHGIFRGMNAGGAWRCLLNRDTLAIRVGVRRELTVEQIATRRTEEQVTM